MTPTVQDLSTLLNVEFYPYQVDAFQWWSDKVGVKRACLYYRTGAGKSLTALTMIALEGSTECLVIAPPVTWQAWTELGDAMGVKVTAISHAKFRMKDYKVPRTVPIICDEFHLLGGHQGAGWKKFDRLSAATKSSIIICSATPNYNDIERVYCVDRVLHPGQVTGGFLSYLYRNCNTSQNPFGLTPLVDSLINYDSAEDMLANMPDVLYVPDDAQYTLTDIELNRDPNTMFDVYNLDSRKGRVMLSAMERRVANTWYVLADDYGDIREDVWQTLEELSAIAPTPVIIYCNSLRVLRAVVNKMVATGVRHGWLCGGIRQWLKNETVRAFKNGEYDFLVTTSTLATGVDGLDKVCDMMIIMEDTLDASLRRQLIGRILPRGSANNAASKMIYRLVIPDAP